MMYNKKYAVLINTTILCMTVYNGTSVFLISYAIDISNLH